ncbi:MAG: iron uptake transporter deferrochelatase/peroxidase subunit [Acidimicrobiales bacterium]
MSPISGSAGLSRRAFLGRGSVAAGAAVGAGLLGVGCASDAATDHTSSGLASSGPASSAALDPVDFHGPHQAGIVTDQPSDALLAAFDVVAPDRDALAEALQALTRTARVLTQGEAPPTNDPLLPPEDNLILGPRPSPDGLTITVSVGASLFDGRYGLADRQPSQLVAMPDFPNDRLDADQTHGDLLIQICGGAPDTCQHALRRLMRVTRRTLVLRWLLPGFVRPNTQAEGTSTRNLLGFKDGTANPDGHDAALVDQLVWVPAGDPEPAWATGGSYHVVRLIRMNVEFWDRTPLRTQETIIGRTKESGAPLDGLSETDLPDFASDPHGSTFRLDGHIRLANPRTEATEQNRIHRRGFNYAIGFDRAGQLDQGLLFQCFQRDLQKGFVTVQQRLDGEALEEYIKPFGGGYFFALPGVADSQDWLGRALLT